MRSSLARRLVGAASLLVTVAATVGLEIRLRPPPLDDLPAIDLGGAGAPGLVDPIWRRCVGPAPRAWPRGKAPRAQDVGAA